MACPNFIPTAILAGCFVVFCTEKNVTVTAQCQNSKCEGRNNSSNITGPRWPEEVKREEGM